MEERPYNNEFQNQDRVLVFLNMEGKIDCTSDSSRCGKTPFRSILTLVTSRISTFPPLLKLFWVKPAFRSLEEDSHSSYDKHFFLINDVLLHLSQSASPFLNWSMHWTPGWNGKWPSIGLFHIHTHAPNKAMNNSSACTLICSQIMRWNYTHCRKRETELAIVLLIRLMQQNITWSTCKFRYIICAYI